MKRSREGNPTPEQASSRSRQYQTITEPDPFDVRLGKGQGNVDNPGNKRLKFAIDMHAERYNSSKINRNEKTDITREIVHFIKYCGTNPGRFIKYDPLHSAWVEIDDEAARLKVSCDLRKSKKRIRPKQGPETASMDGPADLKDPP